MKMKTLLSTAALLAATLCTTAAAGPLRLFISSPYPLQYETVWQFGGETTASSPGVVQAGSEAAWQTDEIYPFDNPAPGYGYRIPTNSFAGRTHTPYPPPHELWPDHYRQPTWDHPGEVWISNETSGESVEIAAMITDYLGDRIGFEPAADFSWNAGDVLSWEGDVWMSLSLSYFGGEGLPYVETLEDPTLPPLSLAIGAPGDLPMVSVSSGREEVLLSETVPEPSTALLVAVAVSALLAHRRMRATRWRETTPSIEVSRWAVLNC